MAQKHPVGTVLRYCHEGADRRAQVTEVHPDNHPNAGEPKGLAIYGPATFNGRGEPEYAISHGVSDPKPVAAPADRGTHGHFWKQD